MRARDVKALLDIVELGYEANGTEPFPPSVLWKLVELIPSDACVGYHQSDLRDFRIVEEVKIVGDPPSRAVVQASRELDAQDPLSCGIRAREKAVLRLSDFIGARQRRRLEYYAEVWRPHGIEDALRLWVPAPPGHARTIYLERSGPKYTDREKTLMSLLRPHLARIRAARESRATVAGAALTERETEVMRHVADGRTNAQIAKLLFISPHTVRTHLEHIFEKLGVETRTAAAARFNGAHANAA